MHADTASRYARNSGRRSGLLLLVIQETFIEHLLCVNSVQSTEDVLGNQEAKSRAYRQVTETDEKPSGHC